MYRVALAAAILILTALAPANVSAQAQCPPTPANPFAPGSPQHLLFEVLRDTYDEACALGDPIQDVIDQLVDVIMDTVAELILLLLGLVDDVLALVDNIIDQLNALLDAIRAWCYDQFGGPPHPVCDAIPNI